MVQREKSVGEEELLSWKAKAIRSPQAIRDVSWNVLLIMKCDGAIVTSWHEKSSMLLTYFPQRKSSQIWGWTSWQSLQKLLRGFQLR